MTEERVAELEKALEKLIKHCWNQSERSRPPLARQIRKAEEILWK